MIYNGAVDYAIPKREAESPQSFDSWICIYAMCINKRIRFMKYLSIH